MTPKSKRWLAALVLSFGLFAAVPVIAAPPEPPPAEGEQSEGRTLDGYFLGAILGGLVFFIVGKSARRT